MRLTRWIRYMMPFLREKTPVFGDVYVKTWGTSINDNAEKVEIPKTIWIYWNTCIIDSETVNVCINEIKRLNPYYEIHIVSQKTVIKYLPDLPPEIFKQSPTSSSDFIRLKLLAQYGGFYLDATILLSESLDWARVLQQQDLSEAILYYTDENTTDKRYPMIENSFIGATKNSAFIKAWCKEYEACIMSDSPDSFYKKNTILNSSDFPLDPNYYLAYLSGQVVMRTSQNFRLSLVRAEDDFFLYSLGIRKKWGEMAMAEILLLNESPNPKPKAVKLIRYARKRLDFFIKRKMFKKGSWMGDLIFKEKTR